MRYSLSKKHKYCRVIFVLFFPGSLGLFPWIFVWSCFTVLHTSLPAAHIQSWRNMPQHAIQMKYVWPEFINNLLLTGPNKVCLAGLTFNTHSHKQLNVYTHIDKVTSLKGSLPVVDLYTVSNDEEPHCRWHSTVTKWLKDYIWWPPFGQ